MYSNVAQSIHHVQYNIDYINFSSSSSIGSVSLQDNCHLT